ncbi:MAG: hypothetical protein OEM49_02345 [Myxococcales bacterium]|nr:hypothetical protein [Myxococcales bacterium]MDH5306704.1 hypothetical protein [Myxococcales bacterium]MDH5565416.1 hypothetical protein [Myxococcales bacterium]
MSGGRMGCAAILVACGLLVCSAAARAQHAATRLLSSLSVHERRGRVEVQIHLGVPVRYLGHTPTAQSERFVLEIAPLAADSAGVPEIDTRGVLTLSNAGSLPLDAVRADGPAAAPRLEIRFSRPVVVEIGQADDPRSIVVSIDADSLQGRDAARGERLLREAQAALTAQEIDRAILLCTSALALEEGPHTPRALELLGVARERKGQFAQAIAQYRTYLERYPEGEDSERVRQRMQTLISARDAPARPLRRAERPARATDYDIFGSVASYYTRAGQIGGDFGGRLLDSSQLADVYLSGRLRTPSLELRSRVAGNYRFDYRDQSTADDARIRDLSVELIQRNGPLRMTLGRQSRNRGGVLGRFDGLALSYALSDSVELGAVSGFPLDTGFSNAIDTDVVLGGLRLGLRGPDERVSGELYGIYQDGPASTDRAALGGELRYRGDWGVAGGFVDYDVYFASLNRMFLVGNWNATPALDLNALVQYGNAPFLTSRSALIGSGVTSLDDLPGNPDAAAVRDLALDRTGKATNFAIGGSYRFLDVYRFTLDLNAGRFSGTRALNEQDATGFEFSYLAQVSRDALFLSRDSHTLGVRAFDGESARSAGVYWLGRLPLSDRLYVNPRLLAEFRDAAAGANQWLLTPALRVEYRLDQLIFDLEGRYEVRLLSTPRVSDTGSFYSIDLGLRYEF